MVHLYSQSFLGRILELISFYVLPFFLTVYIPIYLGKIVVEKFIVKKKCIGSYFRFYSLCVIVLALLANLIWESLIFNHLYYEWDRFFNPYSLVVFESPVVDTSSSWIAKGWSLWNLFLIWFLITIVIYTISAVLTLFFYRNEKKAAEIKNFVIKLTLTLTIMSLIFGLLNGIALWPVFAVISAFNLIPTILMKFLGFKIS